MSGPHDTLGMDLASAPGRVQDRADFLTKTYNVLMGSIVAFVGLELVFFGTGAADAISAFLLQGSWLWVLGGFMIVGWLASHTAHRAESLPVQVLALAGFVLAEAIIFVPLLHMAEAQASGVIQSAAVTSLLGFAGLSAVVFTTRHDFSFLGGLLRFGFVLALVAIVAGVLFGFQLGTWFSVAMVGLASGAILYDTSNVLHHYPEDRSVAAALELFSSVALLFWYVLRLFMSRD